MRTKENIFFKKFLFLLVLSCALMVLPQGHFVAEAIADGDYGVWTPSPVEHAMLEGIFPDGVCDFSQPDAGLPPGW